MTATTHHRNRYPDCPCSSSLADVIDIILDKGMIIDIYACVSVVGLELLRIDARIVVASVDTYLRFAELVNRLDLTEPDSQGLPELMENVKAAGARGKIEGATEAVKEKVTNVLRPDDEYENESSRSRQ
jgi:gas vesicle structural protein